jgi:hypothetical protein
VRIRSKSTGLRAGAVVVLGAAFLIAALIGSAAAAGPSTLTFKENEKAGTFTYIDNAPKSKGKPQTISAGDEIVVTNPLETGGQKVGRLQASCVATKTTTTFAKAAFNCSGTFILNGEGTLVASTVISGSGSTEGAIIGGTGKYAGASGTFVSKEGKGFSTVTISLE